jgi:hypothetical protein
MKSLGRRQTLTGHRRHRCRRPGLRLHQRQQQSLFPHGLAVGDEHGTSPGFAHAPSPERVADGNPPRLLADADGRGALDAEPQCTRLAVAHLGFHRDADTDVGGTYSGFSGQLGGTDTTGQTFLRGYQVTDADGRVEFTTIYPGWYPGRALHIHLKVYLDSTTLLTSQLYFPETTTALVYAQAPYASRSLPDTTNETGGIIRSGGVRSLDEVVLEVTQEADGYAAVMAIGVAG